MIMEICRKSSESYNINYGGKYFPLYFPPKFSALFDFRHYMLDKWLAFGTINTHYHG